ncbi:MAG: glycosyltransferase family 4 protein [Chloroflexi bacterium]|nr:glycosyltransferase family 4 protein [Chloroflexota bacterium]
MPPLRRGGGISYITNLLRGFLKHGQGVSILVACPPGSYTEAQARELGFPCVPVPFQDKFDFRSVLELRRICREERIDVIHSHDILQTFLSMMAAKMTGVPLVASVHMVGANKGLKPGAPRRTKLYAFFEFFLFKLVDRIIVLSEANKKDLIAKEHVSARKITVVPGCIDFPEPSSTEANDARTSDSTVAVLCPTRAGLEKGTDVLLRAAALVLEERPAAEFLVVGEGPAWELQLLQKLAKDLDIESRVRFMGFVDNMEELYRQARVTVLPSRTEGLGMTLLESLSYGTPVIGTRVGGIAEIVEDGVNGLLVPSEDHRALAKAILTLLNDDNMWLKLARADTRAMLERFHIRGAVEAHKRIYRDLLGKDRAQEPGG